MLVIGPHWAGAICGSMQALPPTCNCTVVIRGGEGLDAFTRRIYGAVRDIAEKDAGPTILVKLQFADGKFTVEKVINPNG